MASASPLVLWFSQVDKQDVRLVGEKGANLGEMVRAGFPVPKGFIVTTHAYFQFLRENNLAVKIQQLLSTVSYERADSLMQVSSHLKRMIMQAEVSDGLVKDITAAYSKLGGVLKDAVVAVRASELHTASMRSRQQVFLDVKGEANLILKIKEGWASLFEPQVLLQRHEHKLDHAAMGIAMIVEKMVQADRSGVMFTIDHTTNDKTKLSIQALYGLGELLGQVMADHYVIDKQTMGILQTVIAHQQVMVQHAGGKRKQVKVPARESEKQKLTGAQIMQLAELGKKIEHHYYFPQEITWAIEKDQIFILRARPIPSIQTAKDREVIPETTPTTNLSLLVTGEPASAGLKSGPVKIVKSAADADALATGDILVATHTNYEYVAAMKRAGAIVTNEGGRTSYTAVVSREIGVPAVVGAAQATKLLTAGSIVTVNGTTGEVYKGAVHLKPTEMNIHQTSLKTATKVYMTVIDEKSSVEGTKEADGVGVLSAEFMIRRIGKHPKQMLLEGKKKEYIAQLAGHIAAQCDAFQGLPVLYRASHFTTSGYRELSGGKTFEKTEPNPSLGARGVYRYLQDPEIFEMEMEAIKLDRHTYNKRNLWLLLPFVRTIKELIQIKQVLSTLGLHRSPTFQLWMLIETPTNVLQLDKFIEVGLDGVSIGLNNLSMLMQGVDWDNHALALEYDQLSPSVLWAVESVIKIAHTHHIASSISLHASPIPSAVLDVLVSAGITGVSVLPDAITSTREKISQIERKLIMERHVHQ